MGLKIIQKSIEKKLSELGISAIAIIEDDNLIKLIHKEDIKTIEELYKLIIKNCVILAKCFNFTQPAEIYSMYRYLLLEGYLSAKRNITFSQEEDINIQNLGAKVITGKCVCRHISAMLKDIYKEKGLESEIVTVLVKVPTMLLCPNKDNKPLEQSYELIDTHLFKDQREDLKNKIHEHNGKLMVTKESPDYEDDFLDKNDANHTITLVTKNGVASIYDATNNIIYSNTIKINKEGAYLIANHGCYLAKIFPKYYRLFNDKTETKAISSNLLLPRTLPEEDEYLMKESRQICTENLDILENFYDNNTALYDEIVDKTKTIYKTKKKLYRK